MPYLLRCAACDFQDTVESRSACLSVRDIHLEQLGGDHAVQFELVDEEPFFRGGTASTGDHSR